MIELHLPAMTCAHCVRAVTEAVHRIDPKAEVQVDLATRTARLSTSADPLDLRQALAEEGYRATE